MPSAPEIWDFPPSVTFFAALATLALGAWVTRRVPPLAVWSIPIAVTGGLIVALMMTTLSRGWEIRLDFAMDWRTPIMLAFFTTIGLNASYLLLLRGGRATLIFTLLALGLLIAQNGIGVLVAWAMDLPPIYGLFVGSMTLSGGHGTGLAWAETLGPMFPGLDLEAIAILAATAGLIAGGLIGGPLSARLITRHRLQPRSSGHRGKGPIATMPVPILRGADALPILFLIGSGAAAGWWVPTWIGETSWTIPGFVWAILVGIIGRNLCDATGIYAVPSAAVFLVGEAALGLFLAMAMMSIDLDGLWNLALPFTILLLCQIGVMALFARWITWPVMGGNYDAAVIAGGHCGFGLGATPTAMANMQAVTQRFAPSAAAFLVVPIVGAFFIDILNVAVIESFLALFPH